jgi:hypothetical protein
MFDRFRGGKCWAMFGVARAAFGGENNVFGFRDG